MLAGLCVAAMLDAHGLPSAALAGPCMLDAWIVQRGQAEMWGHRGHSCAWPADVRASACCMKETACLTLTQVLCGSGRRLLRARTWPPGGMLDHSRVLGVLAGDRGACCASLQTWLAWYHRGGVVPLHVNTPGFWGGHCCCRQRGACCASWRTWTRSTWRARSTASTRRRPWSWSSPRPSPPPRPCSTRAPSGEAHPPPAVPSLPSFGGRPSLLA